MAFQPDPTKFDMQVLLFNLNGRINTFNRGLELNLLSSKLQWSVTVLTYNEDEKGLYNEFIHAKVREPLVMSNVNKTALVNNILFEACSEQDKKETYYRIYFIYPTRMDKRLHEMLDKHLRDLDLTKSNVQEILAGEYDTQSLLEFAY